MVEVHDQLKGLARSFLGAAFMALTREHVIPPSRFHFFLRVGHDYSGWTVRGQEFDDLEAELNRSFPDRFADPLKRPHPEFAAHFMFSLLEGSIAAIAHRGELFAAVASSVDETIDQLIDVLESPESISTCCRAMSHLTTDTGKPIELGKFFVYPEVVSSESMIEITEQLVPGARSAFGLEEPNFYDLIRPGFSGGSFDWFSQAALT